EGRGLADDRYRTRAAPQEQVHASIFAHSPLAPIPSSLLLRREEIAAVLIDQLQRAPAAARDARQRIVGDVDVQARLFGNQPVEIAQQRAAAGEHDAALGDVRAELGRRLLERALDRADDAAERLVQRFEDLV